MVVQDASAASPGGAGAVLEQRQDSPSSDQSHLLIAVISLFLLFPG